jgi:hypothetical protein
VRARGGHRRTRHRGDELKTYSNGVRKVTYRDPEGNEVGFGGLPD